MIGSGALMELRKQRRVKSRRNVAKAWGCEVLIGFDRMLYPEQRRKWGGGNRLNPDLPGRRVYVFRNYC